jgi:hypothetical protein
MTPRTEVIWAVNCERARCCRIVATLLAELATDDPVRVALAERLERMKSPWRVRQAAKHQGGRGPRKHCSHCGSPGHYAPTCPDRRKKAA